MEEIYYFIVGITGLYALIKFKFNKEFVFLFLVFWYGFFHFVLGDNFDYFKVVIFVFGVVLFGNKIFEKNDTYDKWINRIFIAFTLSFWISYFLNPFPIINALSQYLLKYLLPLLIYHWWKKSAYNPVFISKHFKYITFVLIIQVLFSLLKISTIGFREMTVGSVQADGGALAVSMPLAAIIFYSYFNKGIRTKTQWLTILSFLLIALASTKRTPAFLFPVFLFLMIGWVQGKKRLLISLVKYAPLVIVLFYVGFKLVPSLNPEKKIWGSFSPEHTINYALGYQFGLTPTGERKSDIIDSYSASAIALFSKDTYNRLELDEMLFGRGYGEIKLLADSSTFLSRNIEIRDYGNLGGAFLEFLGLGILGFLLFFILNILIIKQVHGRIKWVILLFYLYIYFFYTGNVFSQLSTLLVFIPVVISNIKGIKYWNGAVKSRN